MAKPIVTCPKDTGITVPYGLVFVDGKPREQRKCPQCGTLYKGV